MFHNMNPIYQRLDKQNRPLTDDELRIAAPSIFAEEPHESRSDRYVYIPTSQVVDHFRKEGFEPYSARQGRSRIPGKADFTKHMIRFRHAGQDQEALGDERFEVCLLNSHDGTSSYRISAGVFRLVCLNGLMVGNNWEDVKVRHSGSIEQQLTSAAEGAYKMLELGGLVKDHIADMKSTQLSEQEQGVLARAALPLRFEPDAIENGRAPTEAQVLRARRYDDQDSDLWTTFNRVQENLVRGGQRIAYRDEQNRYRRNTTRAVNSIDGDTKLNKALWTLADEMRKLKVAA